MNPLDRVIRQRLTRPKAINLHIADLEEFFGLDEWELPNGRDFNARRAVRSLERYIGQLERAVHDCEDDHK